MARRTTSEERFETLLGRVYDAVADAELWSGIAYEIATTFESTSTVLKVYRDTESVSLLDTTENLVVPDKERDWAEHWHRNDLWVQRSVAYGMSRIVTSQELVPKTEFERSAFYQEWTKQLQIYHMIGAVFPIKDDLIGVLGIHRPPGARSFDSRARRRVSAFLPHIQRALRLRHQVSLAYCESVATAVAVAQSDTGIMVVDAQCRLLYANPLAELILRCGAGLGLAHGKLRTSDSVQTARLVNVIRDTARRESGRAGALGGVLSIQRYERLPVTLSVVPLSPAANLYTNERYVALVLVKDPEHPAIRLHCLRDLFGLTMAEAAVAVAIAEGRSPKEISCEFRVGLGTVRSHIKHLMAKCGVARQAQLVTLVLRSVASLPGMR